MDDAEKTLLARVADLYFNKKMSQEDIASKLFFSRSKVSRLLQRAQDTGVVEIRINFPYVRMSDLEESICKRYGLKNCLVLRTEYALEGGEPAFESVTRFAARHIERHLKPAMRIGVSSGQTVSAISRHINGVGGLNLKFVQVKGMASEDGRYDFDSPAAIHILADKFESSFSQLYAPMYVNNEIARRYLLNEPLIANVLAEARKTDLVIASVRALGAKHNIWSDFLSAEHIRLLRHKGAVGSMMGHFFDRNGRIVDEAIENQIVGLSVGELSNLKHLMVVAEGAEKALALGGALHLGCITTLIIDDKLAKALLS